VRTPWEHKSLGEVCEILDSRRRPVSKSDRRAGPYPYYGATGIVDYVDEYIFDERLVLVGEDGAKWGPGEATAFSVSGRCWINNHAHVLRPIRTTLLDEWLVHYLVHADLASFVSGLTVPKLNQGNLREIVVPVPSVAEQRRIIAILDEAFQAIAMAKANSKKNLQNAKEWSSRAVTELLDRACADLAPRPLEDLVSSNCTLSYGIVQPGDEVPGGMPIVRPVDLGSRVVGLANLKRIDPALARSYARTTLTGGDLLLCVRGTTGLVAMAAHELAGANVTRGIVPIRFEAMQLSQEMGEFLLRGESVQTQIRAKTYGTALMQINIADVRRLALKVPPIAQQPALVKKMVAMQAAADQLVSGYARKLAALDELKQSLLHQAFTGQLTAKSTDRQLAEAA